VGRTENHKLISVTIPEDYRWYSLRIQRNSLVSNL